MTDTCPMQPEMVGLGRGARDGVLVKSGGARERLETATTLVVDRGTGVVLQSAGITLVKGDLRGIAKAILLIPTILVFIGARLYPRLAW